MDDLPSVAEEKKGWKLYVKSKRAVYMAYGEGARLCFDKLSGN